MPSESMHHLLFAVATAFLSLVVTPCSARSTQHHAPNIVLLLADDLGYSDLGCYGGEIRTPNLDALATAGVRFTQFYNAARCCPTRASLLTGLYPHQAGVGHMTYDAGEPGYRGQLSSFGVTLAELLGTAGYQTMMCGKWHVTPNTQRGDAPDNWPLQRGFDRFFGTLPGHGSFWDPAGLMRDNEFIAPEPGFFYTDAIADHAVDFLDDAVQREAPFFLYVAFTAPHYPLHAREETIERYAGVYDDGWDAVRRRRYQRLISLGLLDAKHQLPPRDEAVPLDKLGTADQPSGDASRGVPWTEEPYKQWQAQRMQVYAAMVDEMDQGIGRIVAKLKAEGALDNTLLVFLSDNGASCEGHRDNKIERMDKPWSSSLIPERAPDGSPVIPGDFPGMRLGPANTYGSYGLRWASVSNTPFRRHKSWVHEGGIAAPCIVHWPTTISQGGALCDEVCHIIDLMPTLVDVAGANYPATYRGNEILPMAGKSLVEVLSGEPLDRDYLCWEHEGNRAIRRGRWKLVSEYPGTWTTLYPYPKQGDWELYDMESDRTELHDLAEENGALVEELSAIYDDWANQSMVVPWADLEEKKE